MYIPNLVSVVIPSRNEPFLKKTILDLLEKAQGEIEIIVNLDGYWPPVEDIVDNPRVIYIHRSKALGMRAGINSGVALAKGEYILKTDAHCMFDTGFDVKLKEHMKDNWVVVPRRYPLDPEKWQLEDRVDRKYPIDYMYLSPDLHGEVWIERRDDPKHRDLPIDDLMSAQGSCYFIKKDYYHELELLDEESYGTFYNEFQEVGLKCWLSGGEVKVNKQTWYAHWHKTDGRGYTLDREEQARAQAFTQKWLDKAWKGQVYPLQWLVDRFAPVPGWKK
jgi:glycosyltransferase involved in cell wall biosynthesis